MKKTFAMLTAMMMTAAIAVPMSAFAEDTPDETITIPRESVNPEEDPNAGQTEIKYTVDASYFVTIPASVTLNKDAPVTKDIGFSEVCIGKGQKVSVTLADAANKGLSTTSDFNVKLKDDDTFATYTVNEIPATTPGDQGAPSAPTEPEAKVFALGDEVAAFAYDGTKNEGATPIRFTAPQGADFAGDYTDKLTFKVAVVDAPATQTKQITGSHDGVNVSVTVTFTPGQTWGEATISDITDIYEGYESKYPLGWNESKGMYTDKNNLWELKNGNSYVGKNDVIDENGTYSLVDTGWGMF